MTCLQITLPVPGTDPAVSALARALTPQDLLELVHAVADTLGVLRPDLFGAGLGTAPEHAVIRPDAADLEYASWMPNSGAIEVASWAAHMRTAVR